MRYCLLAGLMACTSPAPDVTARAAAVRQPVWVVSPAIDVGFVFDSAARWDQWSPRAAFDGTRYLVLWSDDRPRPPMIGGTRLWPDGTLADAQGWLYPATADARGHAVAFDGTSHLLAWTNATDELFIGRLATDTTPIDDAGIRVATQAQWSIALASGPSGVSLLVWLDTAVSPDVHALRIAGGSALDPAPLRVSTGGNASEAPAVAALDAGFLVAWMELTSPGSRVRAARVGLDGTLPDDGGRVLSATALAQHAPAVAPGPVGWAVFFAETTATLDTVRGVGVTPAGTVNSAPFTVCGVGQFKSGLSAGFDGTDWVVGWDDYRGAGSSGAPTAARVTTSGASRDPMGITFTSLGIDRYFSGIVTGGGGTLMLFDDTEFNINLGQDSRAARLLPNGTAGPSVMVSRGPNAQHGPKVAAGIGQWLVVWDDSRNGILDLYAARVDSDGPVLDPAGIRIEERGVNEGLPLAVASAAGTFAIAYTSDVQGTTQLALLDASGALVSGPAFSAQRSTRLVLTSSGEAYLLAWIESGALIAMGVLPQGTLLNAGAPLSASAAEPRGVWNGDSHLLMWVETAQGIRAARVLPDAGRPDGVGRTVRARSPSTFELAFAGEGYLLAGIDATADGGSALWVDRLDAQLGSRDDGGVVLDTAQLLFMRQLWWDGERWVLSYGRWVADTLESITLAVSLDGGVAPTTTFPEPPVFLGSGVGLIAWEEVDVALDFTERVKLARVMPGGAGGGTAQADAGPSDAGNATDGGDASDGGPSAGTYRVGCACDGSAGGVALLLAALASAISRASRKRPKAAAAPSEPRRRRRGAARRP